MSEILRAVLETECVTSRPKYYGGRLFIANPAQTPVVSATVTTVDKAGWFLLTSFYMGEFGGTGGVLGTIGPSLLGFGSNVQLENVQSRRQMYQAPGGGPPGTLVASWLSSPIELDQYLLFAPGERIKFTLTEYNIPFNVQQGWFDVCYAGIEYLMPKEASAYGAA